MDPVTLLVVSAGAAVAALVAAAGGKSDKPSETQRTRNEVRRIGDATVDTMRQTSKDFREHIDRQTRR